MIIRSGRALWCLHTSLIMNGDGLPTTTGSVHVTAAVAGHMGVRVD